MVARNDELDGRPLVQTKAEANGRTLHRIAAGGFGTSAEAARLCERLKAKGCLLYTPVPVMRALGDLADPFGHRHHRQP